MKRFVLTTAGLLVLSVAMFAVLLAVVMLVGYWLDPSTFPGGVGHEHY